jgi:hypothetical protein
MAQKLVECGAEGAAFLQTTEAAIREVGEEARERVDFVKK